VIRSPLQILSFFEILFSSFPSLSVVVCSNPVICGRRVPGPYWLPICLHHPFVACPSIGRRCFNFSIKQRVSTVVRDQGFGGRGLSGKPFPDRLFQMRGYKRFLTTFNPLFLVILPSAGTDDFPAADEDDHVFRLLVSFPGFLSTYCPPCPLLLRGTPPYAYQQFAGWIRPIRRICTAAFFRADLGSSHSHSRRRR